VTDGYIILTIEATVYVRYERVGPGPESNCCLRPIAYKKAKRSHSLERLRWLARSWRRALPGGWSFDDDRAAATNDRNIITAQCGFVSMATVQSTPPPASVVAGCKRFVMPCRRLYNDTACVVCAAYTCGIERRLFCEQERRFSQIISMVTGLGITADCMADWRVYLLNFLA
jgi:hypothetical protein